MREGPFLWLLAAVLLCAAVAGAEEPSSSSPSAEDLPLNAQRTGTLPAGAHTQARYLVHVPTALPLLNVRLYRRTAFTSNHSRQLLCLSDGPTPPECVPVANDADGDDTDVIAWVHASGTRIQVHSEHRNVFDEASATSESGSSSDSTSTSTSSMSSSSGEEPVPRTLVETLYNVYVENVRANATFWVVVAGTGAGYDYDVRSCAGGCATKCLLDCFGHGACSPFLHLCQCDPGYSGLACSHGREDNSSDSGAMRWWSRLLDALVYSALAVVLATALLVAALLAYQWCRYGRCCACCGAAPCGRRARRRSLYAKFDPAAHAPGVVHYRSVSTRNLLVYRAAPQVAVPRAAHASCSNYAASGLLCDAVSPSVNSWGTAAGSSGSGGTSAAVLSAPDTAPLSPVSPSDMSLSPASSFTRVYLKKR